MRIDTVVVSTQHIEAVSHETIAAEVRARVIDPVLAGYEIGSDGLKTYVNPTGKFVIGGPMGDAGVTGRKIIVDSYGGMARHGGGAFSGKDPSKVDRSAAYAMRWVAKNVVAAGLAERCEVQVAYAIGRAHPVGFYTECFGTEKVPVEQITEAVLATFDLRPAAIIRARPDPSDLLPGDQLRPLRTRAGHHDLGAHRPRRGSRPGRQGLTGWTCARRARMGSAHLRPTIDTAAAPAEPRRDEAPQRRYSGSAGAFLSA